MLREKPHLLLAAGFFLFVSSLPGICQNADSLAAAYSRVDSLHSSVVLSRRDANYLSKGKDMRVEVISSAGLQKMACCNLAESFENSASVTVGYSDAVTGARQIRLLGLSGVYTQMLDENRPFMRGLAAPWGLGFVPGQWLESIQIAKGSPSVVNGGESMTGQINIEHRKPTDEIPLFLALNGMSDSRMNLDFVSSFPLGERFYTALMGHVEGNFMTHDMNGDGFMDDPKSLQFNVSDRWLYYTPSLQVRFGIRALQDHRQGGQSGYDKVAYTFGSTAPWGSDVTNRSLGAYLKVGVPLRDDQSSSVAAIVDYTYNAVDAFFGASCLLGKQHSAFLNLLYRNQVNESHDFTVGLSATADRYDKNILRAVASQDVMLPLAPSFFVGGAYGEYTFHSGDVFTAILGARLDYYGNEGVRAVPRATLKWQPASWLVLRANGGRGLRYSDPLIDNIGVFSTGKKWSGDYDASPLEKSWTYGGNATFYLPFGQNEETSYVSFDFFRCAFSSQMVPDYEMKAGEIAFYVTPDSYTNNYQMDFSVEPIERFTLGLTARFTDAKVLLKSKGLVEKPLLPRFKGVLNLQYRTNLSRWIFDFTAALNGSARLYDFMEGDRSPLYPLLYAQVTRRFKGWDIYIGGENLTNFTQKSVIQGPRRADGSFDPSSALFDASAVWGPLMGIRLDAGIRITIWK